MILFLLTVLLVYGGMHAYAFARVRPVLPARAAWTVALAAALLVLMFSPFFVVSLSRAGRLHAAQAIGRVGYTWMAMLLWFVCLHLAGDLWSLATRRFALAIPPRALLVASGAGVLLLSVWGLVEASRVRVRTVTIRTAKLPPGSAPVRIAQIADLHLGPSTGRGRAAHVARLIEEIAPDALVSTGDLLDARGEAARELLAPLAALEPPLGKFAVFGNHEFYVGADESAAATRAAGFRLLRGESVTLPGGRVRLEGVDDPAARRMGDASRTDEGALREGDPDVFTILLKHQPVVEPGSIGRFDLQLSGHTHGGQVFPFMAFVWARYGRIGGLYRLAGGAHLYVSRGAGTWGPPMRVLSPPEVTLFVIEPAEEARATSSSP